MFLKTDDTAEDESTTRCNRCDREAIVAVADDADDDPELLCASHDAQTIHDIKVYRDQ